MSDVFLLLVMALASYRLVRVVTLDKITEPVFEPLRQWLEIRWVRKQTKPGSDEEFDAIESDEWNSKLAYLFSCPWCLGFWVCGAVTVIVSLAYGLDYPILTWLASSTIVGLIGALDSE